MKKLIGSLGVACLFVMLSCGDDATPSDDPGDPNEFCNVEICVGNDTFKNVCIDEYNDCVAKGGDKQNCAAGAIETCTI
jgi:hypothetical protein